MRSHLYRMFRRLFRRTPSAAVVTGPHRIYVRRAPLGVELDVSHFVGDVLVQLARDFAEDPETMAADLEEIAGLYAASLRPDLHPHAQQEMEDRAEALLNTIGGGTTLLYGMQVERLARALNTAAPARAEQRQGGAAA
jgi:hypothetical protein